MFSAEIHASRTGSIAACVQQAKVNDRCIARSFFYTRVKTCRERWAGIFKYEAASGHAQQIYFPQQIDGHSLVTTTRKTYAVACTLFAMPRRHVCQLCARHGITVQIGNTCTTFPTRNSPVGCDLVVSSISLLHHKRPSLDFRSHKSRDKVTAGLLRWVR